MERSKLLTLHGHNMFDISSMVQKSIRRGLLSDALYAANEMSATYRPYLWKRLLTVSAEDCFDMVSGKVNELYQLDNVSDKTDKRYISEAVCYLVTARKNRDADYFACNLFNSKHKMSLSKIDESIIENCSCQYVTPNGHNMFDCARALISAIEKHNFEVAGYCANELYYRYRKYLWTTLTRKAEDTKEPTLLSEILSLKSIDLSQKCTNDNDLNILFASKAILLIIKTLKYGIDVFCQNPYRVAKIEQFDCKYFKVPEYVFDCHTWLGKSRGKTTKDFVTEEQKGLYPLKQGEFDNSSWERFFDMLKTGFENKEVSAPMPDKARIKELNEGTVQLSLF